MSLEPWAGKTSLCLSSSLEEIVVEGVSIDEEPRLPPEKYREVTGFPLWHEESDNQFLGSQLAGKLPGAHEKPFMHRSDLNVTGMSVR